MKNKLFKKLTLLCLISGMASAGQLYELEFISNWSSEAHLSLPGNAHFSPVLALSHASNFDLLPLGNVASSGLELLAETGNTAIVLDEINSFQELCSENHIGDIQQTESFFPEETGDSLRFTIEITPEAPYLSLVTMIAPSPDWIVGVSSLKLYSPERGFYDVEDLLIPLNAINAGTENGDRGGNFSTRNSSTSPQENINYLNGSGFKEAFVYLRIRRVN